MDAFSSALNELLVDTYRSIMTVEEEMLKQTGKLDLSIGELHMIEYVARDRQRGKTISEIARHLELSLPSVTIAINKLVKKQYVKKVRCEEDGRRVFVRVTPLGSKANAVHRYFHEQMVRAILREISEEDRGPLMRGVESISRFFRKQVEEMRKNRSGHREAEAGS